MRHYLICFLLFTPAFLKAQEDSVSADRYFNFTYDNDFFSATDRYYTQGIVLNLIMPSLHKSPITKVLIGFKDSSLTYYGLSAEQDCFTPRSIRHEGIFYGERPFAASIYATQYKISLQKDKRQKLTSKTDLGAMGPCAVCEEEQKGLHRALNNIQPLGWENQVRTDVIVNYRLKYEKGFLETKYLEAIGTTEARLGTMYDDLSAGLLVRSGFMYSYFENAGLQKHSGKRKLQFYLFAAANIKAVGYNAMLEGGLFNRNSVYTISASGINRAVFSASCGAVAALKGFSLEYSKYYISQEFYGGLDHGWGRLALTWCF